MISPIHIISIGLGGAFLLGFVNKKATNFASIFMLAALAAMGFISGSWLIEIINGSNAVEIFTAGFKPPYSINLLMGRSEAFLTTMVNIAGFLGGLYLLNTLKRAGNHAIMVYLIFVMGLNVIIMTRDAFNLFVFMEIGSISTAGMILFTETGKSVQSGFKYLIATGVISGMYLLGVVFAYYSSGTLNIDSFAAANLTALKGGSVAVILIIAALMLELKPFPANGWAIDVYHAADPGIAAMIAAGSATALYFVLFKMSAIVGDSWYPLMAAAGLLTFVASNLLGVQQRQARRVLGYSSVGQMGLLVAVLGFKPFLGDKLEFIAITILISHYLAKAGLFWIAGIIGADKMKDWSVMRRKPFLLVLFGTFLFMLMGFPPFPSFFGKWELIMHLADGGQYYGLAFVLVGSFLEAVYLFRWLGWSVKLDFSALPEFKIEWNKLVPVALFGLAGYITGFFTGSISGLTDGMCFFLVLLLILLYALDFLPVYVKNTIAILGMAFFAYKHIPGYYETDLLRFIFIIIFIAGGIMTLIAGYAYKGKREGFYPSAIMMYAGLAMVIAASTTFQFFYGWEIMTLGSYLLILRGKRSQPHAYSYALFSVGGAYLILAAFGLTFAGTGSIDLSALSQVSDYVSLIFAFLAIGFMTKMASLGLHIWLPGAHAEAESDVSPMLSAILLKVGVFGLFVIMIAMGKNPGAEQVAYVLGWIAALTILVGNMTALHQEDAKRLMAYSSIGQLGYILLGMALMTHLGWMTAMTFTINHFLYKSVLFLTVGAVVLRTGTHYMYKMGGLIKRMPLAFIAVLIGIIALSGIPPLSGFAGKWFLYHAIIEKHWYFQGLIALFGGIVAFMYLFKLIYSIFLGQLKDEHRHVKDMSLWFAIPTYILLIGLLVFAAFPQWVLEPVGNMIAAWYPDGAVHWNGSLASISSGASGYWNANGIMVTVLVVFAIVLLWALLWNRKPQKIKQFNIVYSAEVPERPETTHYSYNMFAGFYKALGPVIMPWVERFWNNVSEWVSGVAFYLSKVLYTGNGQTYVTYVVIYIIVMYFFMTF
jgi:formate hydrogenlyase subunit 3/multisubunit Na+/H+ antiporter MnhD subunit